MGILEKIDKYLDEAKKMSIGGHVWKSAMDKPYVVVYYQDKTKNRRKGFPDMESLKEWVKSQEGIKGFEVTDVVKNISGKSMDKKTVEKIKKLVK